MTDGTDGQDGLDALTGLRVVEMGVWVAAPSAGALLADWGADVIKVEPPNGDPMRSAFGSLGIGQDFPNPAFAQDNRGKRSVVLDLRQTEARERLEELLSTADVFLTNLRPDALDGLDLEPAATVARHPRLVYCSVSGYGLPRRGPQPSRLRHRGLLGAHRASLSSWPTATASRSTRAAASATTSAGWPPWPACWRRCSSSARPGTGASSSRSPCCGPGPTCSGGT